MKPVITLGEIMMRLAVPGAERFTRTARFDASYGGGEANVAVSLAAFGLPVKFITRLPVNELGDGCVRTLRSEGVDTGSITRGGDRIGLYFLETGRAQRPSKVIYDRAGSSFADLKPGMIDWSTIFSDASWFHWTGITPAVSAGAAAVLMEALTQAQKAGVPVSCDLNYRAKLWKWGRTAGEVMSELVPYCQLVIGNEEDAHKVFGIAMPPLKPGDTDRDDAAYQTVCQEMVNRFPGIQTVAITLRSSISASHNRWSAVLRHGASFHRGPVYDIFPVIDRVGTGDAFAAGLVYGALSFPGDWNQTLRFAVAASCLKHSIPGDMNAVTLAEVNQLMEGDGSGRIIR